MSGEQCGDGSEEALVVESPGGKKSLDETLKEYRDRHAAIARYRIYHFDPMKPRKQQKTEVERDLPYDEAKRRAEGLNDELKAKGLNRFMDPSYGIELTNMWDTMSQAARERHLAMGKTEKDFRR